MAQMTKSKLLLNQVYLGVWHPSPSVITPALYTVKRIVIGDDVQIQATIEANIISPLVHLLQNAEFDIKKQAAQAISNATSGGTHDQIRFLVSQGCIKPLYDLLCYFDLEVVTVCLQGLENIIKVEEADKNMGIIGGVNLYAQMIDAAEGVKSPKGFIEDLQILVIKTCSNLVNKND
ncbi:hypothetical protein GOBAR_AA23746 [Gossypium barbadense]|uniref:Armadillo repeat-containing domain-containing protein n=1 Tax=Gossypium barbadense TaxID=3634 RepID=A0A2P5X0Q6_GOSBA|nr:hypothetical protein GOBAR_AA23746 [Gossypium barbadense]